MLCFQISINGQKVCLAGNPYDRRLSIDVYRSRNESNGNIFVAGDSYEHNEWSERYIWGNQRLKIGDEIRIMLIEADTPDLPIETHTIKGSEESESLTDSIVKQVAVLWLDHLLHGEPLPFPARTEANSPGSEMTERCCCDFCGKNQDKVRRLIASPGKTYICNECVDVCVDILQDSKTTEPQPNIEPLARWPTN